MSSKKIHNYSFWDKHRGVIRTKLGGWVIGEAVYCHGYDMMNDLVGQKSYFQVLLLNITGRLVDRKIADWLEAYYICNSYPDARIWCNQIGSLGGTLRSSPVASTCAGVLASDSRMYGPGVALGGIESIRNAVEKKEQGLTVKEIVESHQRTPTSPPSILGFSRPVASNDERIEALDCYREQLGIERGKHLSLAYEIQEIMIQKTGEGINLLGYTTALLCDQGFSPMEIYCIGIIVVNSGVVACYSEAANNAPESFFPLQCSDIDYQGSGPREVPDKV